MTVVSMETCVLMSMLSVEVLPASVSVMETSLSPATSVVSDWSSVI